MRRNEARSLALGLMDQHGLLNQGWGFKFDTARNRFGCCNHTRKTISMSGAMVDVNDVVDVQDTILHEIAHALVGSGHGHDDVWKAKCREVGARPQRYADASMESPTYRWKTDCADCGRTIHRHWVSQKKRLVHCKTVLVWERNDKVTVAA